MKNSAKIQHENFRRFIHLFHSLRMSFNNECWIKTMIFDEVSVIDPSRRVSHVCSSKFRINTAVGFSSAGSLPFSRSHEFRAGTGFPE